jgi:uncharacterized protein YndB with AHSA1/START domain
MNPIEAHVTISAPREEIYDLMVDLAGRPAWCDHYQHDYHLTSPRSSGKGAGARFRVKARLTKTYVELTIVEAARPRLIREELRLFRLGRTHGYALYELEPLGRGATRVDLSLWTEPATRLDAFKESLGGRRWLQRRVRKSLNRLRLIFEEERGTKPLPRATIAGYEPAKAPRFGSSA